MRTLWKSIGIGGGIAVITAGTLLLMGNLRSATQEATDIETVKLQSLAGSWSGRLESSRSHFRELILRHQIVTIMNSPTEWAAWRATEKYRQLREDWQEVYGSPRGLVMLTASGSCHSVLGDSTGLASGLARLAEAGGEMILHGGSAETPAYLLLVHRPLVEPEIATTRFVAILDPASVLILPQQCPHSWSLLSGPNEVLFTCDPNQQAPLINNATWPLLLSKPDGTLPDQNGNQWHYYKVELAGMQPMLLVGQVTPHVPVTAAAAALIVGLGVLVLALTAMTGRKSNSPESTAARAAPTMEPVPPVESGLDLNYRSIFQSAPDPMWVLNVHGEIVKVNAAAQDILRVHKGKPNPEINFEHGDMTIPAAEFFSQIAGNPQDAEGPCRFATRQSILFSGDMIVRKLFTGANGKSTLLVQLHSTVPPEENEQVQAAAAIACSAEPEVNSTIQLSPFPVIRMTTRGELIEANPAARETCPSIEACTSIGQVFTRLETEEIEKLLNEPDEASFETLFGGSTHAFRMRKSGNSLLLFGHELSDAKRLEVDLAQVQENFMTLCNLVPAAVLLLDPRDLTILEFNMETCDLFSLPPSHLRGRTFDTLSAFPWELGEEQDEFYGLTSDGRTIRCAFRGQLIKVEGNPTLLIVLEALSVEAAPQSESNDEEPMSEPQTIQRPEVGVPNSGPGLLIVSNPTVRDVARRLLERLDQDCEVFTSLDDATIWLFSRDTRPSVAMIDVSDFDDAEGFVAHLRMRCGDVPCLAITDDEDYALPNGGPNQNVVKPFDLETVADALQSVGLEVPVLPAVEDETH